MLRYLKISNFAIIDNIEIEFREGFNTLTGETGAGKSILIGALGILLGAKSSSEIIRSGSDEARVEGIFELPDNFEWQDETLASLAGAKEIIVSRRINSSGRSRCLVNGELTPITFLQKLAPHLVNIFGQHASHVLLNPEQHTEILDRCQNLYPLRDKVRELFTELRNTQSAFLRLEKKFLDAKRRSMEDAETVEELSSAQLKESEEDNLITERDLLKKAVQVRERSYEAYQSLYGKSGSVLESLSEIKKNIQFLSSVNPKLLDVQNNFDEASYRLEDVALELRNISENFRSDPKRLEWIEERLGLIRKLKKKHSTDLPGLLKILNELSREAGDIFELEKAVKTKKSELESSTNSYLDEAKKLSELREHGAINLKKSMDSELKALSMAEARFEVVTHRLEANQMSPSGLETVEFYLQSNPGETAKPLSKIASGGELSRLMLALKALEIQQGKGSTLIFDEVDAGIGGHTAVAVAERLASIARYQQTLCITHLHQIAAKADHHLAVRKSVKDGRTYLEVTELSPEGRVDELTRMLGASSDAKPVRDHLKRMMKSRGNGV